MRLDTDSFGKGNFRELQDQATDLLAGRPTAEFALTDKTALSLSQNERQNKIGITLRRRQHDVHTLGYYTYPYDRLVVAKRLTSGIRVKHTAGVRIHAPTDGTLVDLADSGLLVRPEQSYVPADATDERIIASFIKPVPLIDSSQELDFFGRTQDQRTREETAVTLFPGIAQEMLLNALDHGHVAEPPFYVPQYVDGIGFALVQYHTRFAAFDEGEDQLSVSQTYPLDRTDLAETRVVLFPAEEDSVTQEYAIRPQDNRLGITLFDSGRQPISNPVSADRAERLIVKMRQAELHS